MAALIAAHRLRPAPTCQHIRKVKSRTASLCENSGELAQQAGAAAPSRRQPALSLTQRGRESGEREGENPARQAQRKNGAGANPGALVINPRRAGTARTNWAFLGGRSAPKERPALARRGEPTEHQNGGKTAHARRTHQEGTTRKMTGEKTEARGAQPPQHPSQGQPPYLAAARLGLDLGVINECFGAVIFRRRSAENWCAIIFLGGPILGPQGK